MPNNETIPTYEEFKAEAIKQLAPMIEGTRKHYKNSLTAEEYVNSKEGTFAVHDAYRSAVTKFNSGRINRSIFLGDTVSGVAYCLYMMYEPYLDE